MDRTPATNHAGHDDLLIARLFGGDVDAPERNHALELMAECDECAALFADLAAVADATELMAVPARPRDFTLTEADAARLVPSGHAPGGRSWLGLRRAFGSSMAALGLLGLVATTAFTWLGSSGQTMPSAYDNTNRFSAQQASSEVAGAPELGPTAGPVAVGAPSMAPAASMAAAPAATAASATMPPKVPDTNPGADGSAAALNAASPTTHAADAATGSALPPDVAAASPGGKAAEPGSVSVPTNAGGGSSGPLGVSGSIDARMIWLGGFGGLFLAGIAILVLPALLRRRSGRNAGR